jgi:hypothetical protein
MRALSKSKAADDLVDGGLADVAAGVVRSRVAGNERRMSQKRR